MARRRLEEALQAGKAIGASKGCPDRFTSISVEHDIQLEKEVGGIVSLQFSFDGKFLAVGCFNGTIQLYDTATGIKLTDIRKTRYGGLAIMSLKFHPKNPSLLYAGTAEGQVLGCDLSDFINDSESQSSQQQEFGNHERWFEILQESQSSKNPEKKGLDKNEINCLDFDYNYCNYATAGKDLNIRLYDSTTNQLVHEFTGYNKEKDPTNKAEAGQTMRVHALRWHPMYDHIFVTGGWENQLKIWDSRCTNDGIKRSIHGPHICGDSLDLKDYKILTGSYCGHDELQLWDYNDTQNKPYNIDFKSGRSGAFLYCAQFCDNDVVLAGGKGTNSAKAINYVTGEVLGEVPFKKIVQALDSTFGGRLFAVGDSSSNLKICNLK